MPEKKKVLDFIKWMETTFGEGAWWKWNNNLPKGVSGKDTPEVKAWEKYKAETEAYNKAIDAQTQFNLENPQGTFVPQTNTYSDVKDTPDGRDINELQKQVKFQEYISNGGTKYTTYQSWLDANMPTSDISVRGDGNGLTLLAGNLYYKDDVVNGKTIRYYFTKATDGTFAESGTEDLGYATDEGGTFASKDEALKYATDNGLLDEYDIIRDPQSGKWVLNKKADTSSADATAAWQQAQLDWEKQKWAEQQKLEREKYLATLKQTPRDWIRYSEEAYGMTPQAPQWLAKYTPQSQVGGQLAPSALPAPSGQWLNRAKPTTRDMLLGYADWSANKGVGMMGDDLLSQTEQMLPTSSPYERNVWKPTKVAGW